MIPLYNSHISLHLFVGSISNAISFCFSSHVASLYFPCNLFHIFSRFLIFLPVMCFHVYSDVLDHNGFFLASDILFIFCILRMVIFFYLLKRLLLISFPLTFHILKCHDTFSLHSCVPVVICYSLSSYVKQKFTLFHFLCVSSSCEWPVKFLFPFL